MMAPPAPPAAPAAGGSGFFGGLAQSVRSIFGNSPAMPDQQQQQDAAFRFAPESVSQSQPVHESFRLNHFLHESIGKLLALCIPHMS
jgi:hypothetical protein